MNLFNKIAHIKEAASLFLTRQLRSKKYSLRIFDKEYNEKVFSLILNAIEEENLIVKIKYHLKETIQVLLENDESKKNIFI